MRKTLLALAATAVLATPGAAAPPGWPPSPKLIEYGWDVPDPTFVRAHIGDMEKHPFDGVVMKASAGMFVFTRKPFAEDKVRQDAADLQATPFRRFTDNFLIMQGTVEEGWDWSNQGVWKTAIGNVRQLASIARAGRFRGIVFDPEAYGTSAWTVRPTGGPHGVPLAAQKAVVRRRGAEVMRAMQAELPGLRLLTFFHNSLFRAILDLPAARRDEALAKDGYALLPSFLDGLLDAAAPGTRIIDGNELAYYYQSSEGFYQAYHTTHRRALALVDPRNREKYGRQVELGQALYMDLTFALQTNPERLQAFYLTPEQRARWFEHNVYHALYTTDEYVWCYGERMNWWENHIPAGAEDAIASARAKIRSGEPLGYEVPTMLQEAAAKARAAGH